MPDLPASVRSLLEASDEAERDAAWAQFLEAHSRLILATARKATEDGDEAMDYYAHTLDRLREDDCEFVFHCHLS